MIKAAVAQATGPASAERRGAADERSGDHTGTLTLGAPKFVASATALATATLIGHLILASWGIGGVLHMLIPALGLWLARPRDVLALGGIGAGLVVAGAVLIEVPFDPVTGLTGIALALLAVATVTLVVYAAKRETVASRPVHRDRAPAAPPRDRAPAPPPIASQGIDEATPSHGIDDATPRAQIRHEVRTPLNAIIGFSEIARRELFGPLGNERYRGYMDDINAAAYQLLDVVERRLEGRDDESASGSRRLPTGREANVRIAPCRPEAVPARRSAAS